MSRRIALLFPLCVLSLFAAEGPVPVLVELFTSEGCSSCPPADRLLTELSHNPPAGVMIVALSEHVDYWDHLGWRDPYSSAQFTARQHAYGELFRLENVYTPQMVVDGMANFLGSDGAQARKMVDLAAKQPKAQVQVARKEGRRISLQVDHLTDAHSEKADVFLALTESYLVSSVAAGENAGARLRHTSVVRSLMKVAQVDARRGAYMAELEVKIDPKWRIENSRAVVFVQDRKTRRIIGAASCSL